MHGKFSSKLTKINILQVEFWTNASNPEEDRETLGNLYTEGFLRTHDDSDTFWNCFHDSYNVNPKEINGKVRVLSIIAERFTYEEIINKLKVSNRICLFF